jgi:hypothetical protein
MTQKGKKHLVANFQRQLEDLIRAADNSNVVLTIELKPLKPLAMGHFIMIPHARLARGHY